MSEALIAGGIFYAAGVGFSFIWGVITHEEGRTYQPPEEFAWERRWGARAMIFCWAWPILLIAMHAPKAGAMGRFIGGVFRDGMKR